MQLDLRGLEVSNPGELKSLHFERELDLSALSWWGESPFPLPVKVSGDIQNRGGYYELSYRAEFKRSFQCSRCLAPVERQECNTFEHTMMESSEDSFEADEFFPVNNGILQLDRIVADDLLLTLSVGDTCDTGCLGICPACGGKRELCGCDTSLPDPRFDIIRKLLEDELE